MVYVGNKLQRSSDAQSDVIHQALTHIATVSDQNKQLIEQDNELTAQVHALVTALAEHPAPQQAVQMQSAITLDGDPDQATGSSDPGERLQCTSEDAG